MDKAATFIREKLLPDIDAIEQERIRQYDPCGTNVTRRLRRFIEEKRQEWDDTPQKNEAT